MKRNIIYVGLDVDDTQNHGSVLDKGSVAIIGFNIQQMLMIHN
jgi:hypothetical protein